MWSESGTVLLKDADSELNRTQGGTDPQDRTEVKGQVHYWAKQQRNAKVKGRLHSSSAPWTATAHERVLSRSQVGTGSDGSSNVTSFISKPVTD